MKILRFLLLPTLLIAAPLTVHADKGGHGRHEFKEKYYDGNCKVERKFKDGKYKEKRKCREPEHVVHAPSPVYVPAPVVVPPPGVTVNATVRLP